MLSNLTPGDLVIIHLPIQQPSGHEQQGRRPALVLGVPQATRYPIVLIAPLTSQVGDWVAQNPMLYPCLNAGTGGLTKFSIVLLDQLRAIDARRILAYLGSLTPQEYQPIANGLRQLFDLQE